jgi:GNAT superfamily N-acetyltransferase
VIIRTADRAYDIEQALEVCWANESSVDGWDKAAVLAHWMAMYASCPEGFWIAEDERSEQIVGVASAVRRPPQWVLANFYTLPGYHGQGIGKQLLSHAFAAHEGCERFLVHASAHPAAQGLYLQFGMYPQPYSILFRGNPEQNDLPAASTVEDHPVADILPTLNAFDQKALGFTRAVDHQQWASRGVYFLVKQADQIVGYFRVSSDGLLGPLVVSDERWMTAVLDWAIRKQKAISSESHDIFVPGSNKTAIRHLLAYGYRLHEVNLLMSSHPMPGLAHVIFHDTDLL